MEYRKGSARICVLISDAPPHGIEPSGDGFPDGAHFIHHAAPVKSYSHQNIIFAHEKISFQQCFLWHKF
jgi:hypothetical protein